jgi:hypothetical protein
MGTILPGHRSLLGRFDSLVLVPPAAYHYLSLLLGPLNTLDRQPCLSYDAIVQPARMLWLGSWL